MPELPPPPPWAHELVTVGVTGTNGKTTTTLLCGAALAAARTPVAMATTLGSFLDREPFEASHDYAGFVATMTAGRTRGGRFAAIELTSEALARGFARAWPCRVGVFTNLSRDHLDAHGSAEHYLASKAQLFMQLPERGAAILNAADPASALLDEVVPRAVRRVRYAALNRGAVEGAEIRGEAIDLSWAGTRVVVAGCDEVAELRIRSIGAIYAENALAALAAAIALGVPPARAAAGIAAAPAFPGRFEVVAADPHVVVDYAHSPDALRRTLTTARALCGGTVTVVFGAGGDRDRDKRPLMGEAASLADRVVVTSDNPRSEDPAAIAAAILDGVTARTDRVVELDRARAIARAVDEAGPGDVVVVAGKGHEATQWIGALARPFSDAAIAASAHARRHGCPQL